MREERSRGGMKRINLYPGMVEESDSDHGCFSSLHCKWRMNRHGGIGVALLMNMLCCFARE